MRVLNIILLKEANGSYPCSVVSLHTVAGSFMKVSGSYFEPLQVTVIVCLLLIFFAVCKQAVDTRAPASNGLPTPGEIQFLSGYCIHVFSASE